MTVEEGTVPEEPVYTLAALPPAPSLLGARRTLVGSPKAAVRTRLYREALEKIRAERAIAVDVETTGLRHWLGDRVVGIAIYCPSINESFYFPFRHGHGEATNLTFGSGRERIEGGALIRRDFGPLLANPDQAKVNFNCKFDQEALYQDTGVLWGGRVWDAQLSAHLLNENEPPGESGLKALSDRYLGAEASQAERNIQAYLAALGVPDKGGLWYLDPEDVTDYACADVELAWSLLLFHLPWLDKYELRQIFEEQCDYAQVVTEMECHGVLIDVGIVEERLTEAEARYDELLAQLREQLGLPNFNPNSPVQCARAFGLFDGKGKPSTAKGLIAAAIARGGWPLEAQGRLLMYVKAWDKVASLYYRKYLELMEARPYDQWYDPAEQRVRLRHLLHCQYRMTGTVAGRLSCTEPNLQAVPRQSDIYRVKDGIVPRPGHWLVEIDYSQAELRMLAHEARIPNMADVLNGEGGDLHTSTAEELTRIRGGRVVPRDVAKRMNFGVVYGLGAPGLAEAMMITEEEAEPFVDAYHRLYPQIRQYSGELQAQARGPQASIRLWTGRMRHYNAARCDCGQRGCMEWHKAMSNKIQGGVGEMLRVAMLDVRSRFWARGVRMVLQIHDSLVLEVPKRSYPADMVLILEILEAMERGPDGRFENFFHRCPPRCDVKYSDVSWSQAETFDRRQAELTRIAMLSRPPVAPERTGWDGATQSNNLTEVLAT